MFEEYLRDYFAENESGMTLDDDMPDAFDTWMQGLDVDEWLEIGDKFIASKAQSHMGKLSASKRDTSSEKMSELAKKRWGK